MILSLVERSYALRFDNPREGLRVAEAAVGAAEAVDLGPEWASLAADLRAEAWGNLANSHRLVENFTAAEEAWQRSFENLDLGSGDPRLRAELLRRRGFFRHLQRRHEIAHDELSSAASIFDRLRDAHSAGKSRMALAWAYYTAGSVKKALEVAPEAAKQLDGFREPELGFMHLHNTLFYLEADDQKLMALRLSERLEGHYQELGSTLVTARGSVLRGQLYAGFEAWKLAAPLFDRARRGFLQLGLTYDAALAGFDLALAWMHSGGFGRVQKLAAEMYDVFTAREIPREAAAALLLFANAARCHQADLRLLLRVKAALDPLRPSQAAPAAPAPRE